MNLFKYFEKNEIDTIDKSFYNLIDLWRSWYKGNVKRFHKYKVSTGGKRVSRERLTMGMAKKVSEDMGDFLLNEKVAITINTGKGTRTQVFVDEVLEQNRFAELGNEYQERKAATGTVAYVPYMTGIEAEEDTGEIVGYESIKINYVEARNIFPISWENRNIIDVIFAFPRVCRRKKYLLLQFHELKFADSIKQYVITNKVLEASSAEGKELTQEEIREISIFADLAIEMKTGSEKPQFVIDRTNIVNNIDEDDTNPMGIPIFANGLDVLKKMDLEYDSYYNEFDLGRKRIFVAPEMTETIDGIPIFDEDDTVFYRLPEDYLANSNEAIKESNMEIRADEHEKAINGDINLLSLKCGFGTDRYRFENGVVKTATEVISEDSDLFRFIQKQENPLERCLKDLVHIIIRLGIAGKEPDLIEDPEVVIDFDDSIIEDKEAERKQDQADMANGTLAAWEYRAKHRNETPEDAKKNLPVQNGVVE